MSTNSMKLRNDGSPVQASTQRRAKLPTKARPVMEDIEATGDAEFIEWAKDNDKGRWVTLFDARLDFHVERKHCPKGAM